MGHGVGPISCMFTYMYVYVLFALIAWFFRPTDSLPIVANETVPRLTPYDTSRYYGRTLKAIDWDSCEFGDTLQPYDEDCPNGAVQVLPCNPGQLKVAECIGQDGDTSRMCEPCPQKYFQSSYNKCTACHPCSECGPNEQIKDLCTDETDTVCESIIPPQPPEPTDPPTDVTDAPGQTPSTQPVIESTEGPTTAVSTAKETTKKAPITDGPVTNPTTQNISAPPPGTSTNQGPSGVTIGIWVMTAFAWIFIVVLMGVVLKLKWELKEEKMKNKDLNRRLAAALSSTVPSSSAEIQSEQGASVQFSGPNGSLRLERPMDDNVGSLDTERNRQVVDCPDDERPLLSRLLSSLSPLLPSRVVVDSEGKKGGKKASAKVTYHAKASYDSHNGRSARDPSLRVTSRPLPTEDRKNLKKSAGISRAERVKNGDALSATEVTPPVNSRESDASHHCNGDPTSSTITTVDVHNSPDLPGERQCGDGDSLATNGVVRGSHPNQGGDGGDSHESLRDRENLGLHPGNDADHSNDHDLHWPAEKVPGSFVLQPPRTYSNELSGEVPPLDSDERWHAEKVPGSSVVPPHRTYSNELSGEVPPLDSDERWHAEKVPGSFPFPPHRTHSNESGREAPPLDSDERWHAKKVPGSSALPPTGTNSNMSSTGVPPTDVSPLYCEVRRHAEKVPGSIAFPPTSANNKMPSKDIPSVIFDEPSLPGKVPGTFIKKGRITQDPDTVTDAHLDNTAVEEHNPRTLRSSAEIPEVPNTEEEELPEDNQEEEEAGANKDDLDMTAATADPDRDVLQNLMEPEATVFNNNTTPPDGRMPEDAKERGKPWKKRSFPFFKKQKRKDPKEEGNQPAQQMQPLLNHMDKMVDEKCLDYVASQLKLKKLDKLCRALGLRDTDVENYRYELEHQYGQGAELAFRMLVKVRDSQGMKLTYGKLNRALRESSNVHVADEMVSKFHLQ